MISSNDYERALRSQDAVNLSGLVNELNEVLPRIWDEAHRVGEGTSWVNTHPIVQMYVSQLAWLSCQSIVNSSIYSEAHNRCIEEAHARAKWNQDF